MNRGGTSARPPEATHVNRTLDSIRGLAALLVVLGHSRFFCQILAGTTFSQLPATQRVLLLPTTVAQESVALFFVLSGYLVGGQILRQNRDARFTWTEYAAKRLSRLWTVLIPGLALTALVALLAHHLLSSSAVAVNGGTGPGRAACNAVFLQESRCSDYGSNISLWSLSYEFWFYVTFAAAACAVFAVAGKRYTRAIVNGLVFAAATALFGIHLFVLIPAWLVGVVVAEAARRPRIAAAVQRRWRPYLALSVAAVGCAMLATNLIQPSRPVLTLIIGVPAAALTLVAVEIRDALNSNPFVRLTAWLGDWSYSLYVFHAPLLVLAVGVAAEHGLASGWGLVATAYAAAAVVLPVCWIGSLLTERHTGRVRRLIFDVLSRGQARRRPEAAPRPAESA